MKKPVFIMAAMALTGCMPAVIDGGKVVVVANSDGNHEVTAQ